MPRNISGQMPADANSAPIPVLVGSGYRTNLTAAVASSNAALPTGASAGQLVLVRSTDYIWLNFGTSGVTASAATSSTLVPPGEGAYLVPAGATHAAVLRVGSADAAVQIESVGG